MIDSELYELLEPGVQALGYELLMVELSGQDDVMSGQVLDGIMGFSGVIARWLREADDRGQL